MNANQRTGRADVAIQTADVGLNRVLSGHSIAKEDAGLIAEFQQFDLVGCSPALLQVFRTVKRVSVCSDVPVLLTGETGVGKDEMARAIHRLDPRRKGHPFVHVSIAALSQSLLESELFGHRRGAFTGAQREYQGLLRAAQGGTVYLSEVEALPCTVQAALLGFLDTHRLRPVGSTAEKRVDLRIIAATNASLSRRMRQGRFREDLYYRLKVLEISIPPLRKRREDIEPQALWFLQRHQAAAPQPVTGIDPQVLHAFSLLPWRGNSRELENVVRAALVLSRGGGGMLSMDDLPPSVHASLRERSRKPWISEDHAHTQES